MIEKKLNINGLPPTWLFPTTRYRGSKRKILPWIWENLNLLDFMSVLDIFGGTSTVSILFKQMGKQVTFNDYSHFNFIGGLTFVENKLITLTSDDIHFLGDFKLNRNNNVVQKYYAGKYFLDNENEWLDLTLDRIHLLEKEYDNSTYKYKKAIAIWALGQACLIKRPFNLFHRFNLNLRSSEVPRSFGNKTTWETPFPIAFNHFINEANSVIFDNGKENYATQQNAFGYNSINFDLVYFDPPYFFQNQNDDNYLRLYHFLDGISQYNNWEDKIDKSSLILKIPKNYSWPYKDMHKLKECYGMLFSSFKDSIIVISHKSGSLVSVSNVVELLIDLGKHVEVAEKTYAYALNKQNGKSHDNTECLIIAT